MLSLDHLLFALQPHDDAEWGPCVCPAFCGDPADFCDYCRADYEHWLDARAEERRAEELSAEGLAYFRSEGGAR